MMKKLPFCNKFKFNHYLLNRSKLKPKNSSLSDCLAQSGHTDAAAAASFCVAAPQVEVEFPIG